MMGTMEWLRFSRDVRQLGREHRKLQRWKLKAAIREDIDLHSVAYIDSAARHVTVAAMLGGAGILSAHSLAPDLWGLFLMPAALATAAASQSFRLTYLRRHPKPLDSSRKELR